MMYKSAFYIFLLYTSILVSQENIEVLASLPNTVSETSGLIFYNGKLITHNDSGNTPELFEIDTVTYQITRSVTISNVENNDWEDITQDDQYIYIGEFGNNKGTRTDLAVYRISKQDYDQSESITAEIINFSYEDQTDFTDTGNSDWDAEAFFVLDNQLVILTKQWQSTGSVAYTLPKVPGSHIAERIDTYNVNGLVTGATYNSISKVLFIVGYTSILSPFTIRIEEVSGSTIFTEKLVRTNLNIGLSQIESITYADANTYFLSSEFFSRDNPAITLDSQLYSFSTEYMEEEEPSEEEEPGEEEEPSEDPEVIKKGIILFKKFGSNLLEYELNEEAPILGQAIFDSSGRRVRYISGAELNQNSVDLTTLNSSVYYITFYLDGRSISIPFLRN